MTPKNKPKKIRSLRLDLVEKFANLRPDDKMPKTTLRYFDEEHRRLVGQAAEKAKLSINTWLVITTLAQARRELGL